jgi:hypothetical protein
VILTASTEFSTNPLSPRATSSATRRRSALAGKALKGDKPADLPVQQATKVELYINLKTCVYRKPKPGHSGDEARQGSGDWPFRLKAALDSYRARVSIIETAFAHKSHALALVFLRHDGAEPHMVATRGASNNRKHRLFGYVC